MNVKSKGSAAWNGDLKNGSGRFRAGDSVFGEYAAKARFEDGQGATPEELIAGAHAACFSMALANILAEAGHDPESIETEVTATMELRDGAPTVSRVELDTVATVPGIDDADFQQHANAAKEGCPVSRALAAVPEIVLSARLG